MSPRVRQALRFLLYNETRYGIAAASAGMNDVRG